MSIQDEMFKWCYDTIKGQRYEKVLRLMWDTEFYSIDPLDDNRIIDGVEARYLYGEDNNIPDRVIDVKFDNQRCSVLEMMVGLCIRLENTVMVDSDYGNRTSMWFWCMMRSLGLYGMTDDKYDDVRANDILETFLEREYDRTGRGGLFTIMEPLRDMRQTCIWTQAMWFFEKTL